jgi:flavin reductase (DIM6/NTAB) family NADH-FMN oxidoreductase RutF
MQEIPINEAWLRFRPERVVLVVSKDKTKANVMPADWCTRCSFIPQLVAVSIGKTRYTHEILSSTKEFVIAVPNKQLTSLIKFSGSCSGRKVDKFKEAKIETEKAEKIKIPLIKKATINFECKKHSSFDSGSHTIFIGEILAAHYNEKGILFNLKNGTFKEFK